MWNKKLFYKDSDWKEKQIIVTQENADEIMDFVRKHEPFKIKNIDWVWEKTLPHTKFMWIDKYEEKQLPTGQYFVCDFWKRHDISVSYFNCPCKEQFWGVLWMVFRAQLRELGYNISYNSDITDEIKRKRIEIYFNKN